MSCFTNHSHTKDVMCCKITRKLCLLCIDIVSCKPILQMEIKNIHRCFYQFKMVFKYIVRLIVGCYLFSSITPPPIPCLGGGRGAGGGGRGAGGGGRGRVIEFVPSSGRVVSIYRDLLPFSPTLNCSVPFLYIP